MNFYDVLLAKKLGGGGGSGSGEWTTDGIAQSLEPNGDIVLGDEVTTLGAYAFAGKPITSIIGNGVLAIGSYAFAGCNNITGLNFPAVSRFTGKYILMTSSVKTVVLPSVKSSDWYQVFQTSTNLEILDTTGPAKFSQQTFSGCGKLNTLILRKNSVVTLSNINVFTGSPFASGKAGGTLYVPQALISSYQSATNWSTILGYANNQILPIEGSIYETQYADGTPIGA